MKSRGKRIGSRKIRKKEAGVSQAGRCFLARQPGAITEINLVLQNAFAVLRKLSSDSYGKDPRPWC